LKHTFDLYVLVEYFHADGIAYHHRLGVVYAAFKKLHDEIKPHQKYYHYKQDICNYIDENWSIFCPDKKSASHFF
jgi:hypothetical protein